MLLSTPASERGQLPCRFRTVLWKEWICSLIVSPLSCAEGCCLPKGLWWAREVLISAGEGSACVPSLYSSLAQGCSRALSKPFKSRKRKKVVICYLLVNSSLEQNFYYPQWRRAFTLDFTQTQNCARALLTASPSSSQDAKTCNRRRWGDWSWGISLSCLWTLVLDTKREH